MEKKVKRKKSMTSFHVTEGCLNCNPFHLNTAILPTNLFAVNIKFTLHRQTNQFFFRISFVNSVDSTRFSRKKATFSISTSFILHDIINFFIC